jgi:hypothetical protein
MAWVKIYSYVQYQRLIDCGNNQVDNVLLMPSKSNTMAVCTLNGVNAYGDQLTSYTATLNTWFHVGWTVSGSVTQVYANGVQVLTNGQVQIVQAVNRTKCYFGQSNWNDAISNADFDEIKFFNRALSQAEVQNDYNNIQSYMVQF